MEDAPMIAERIAPIQVSQFLATVPHPYQLADAKTYLKKVMANQAAEPREEYVIAITLKPGMFPATCLA